MSTSRVVLGWLMLPPPPLGPTDPRAQLQVQRIEKHASSSGMTPRASRWIARRCASASLSDRTFAPFAIARLLVVGVVSGQFGQGLARCRERARRPR